MINEPLDITRYNLLAVIRRASEYAKPEAKLGLDDDTRLLLRAGIMPRTVLLLVFGAQSSTSFKGRQVEAFLDNLVLSRKVLASRTYLRNNPRDRTRPILTRYDAERPTIKYLRARNPVTYRAYGADRLALWYAAANYDFSGSRGEGYGLYLVLQFWRTPTIQKLWRKFIERPTFKLPEDAK